MTAWIDTDIILYRNLFATKDQNYYAQLRACDNTIDNILDTLEPDYYSLVLSGSTNFRTKIYPEYKANRKDVPKPVYLQDAKKYILKYWDGVLTNGIEADDYIAMHCAEDDIIVSTDKDYLQLDRTIYNHVTGERFRPLNPWYHFCSQMLTGDSTDNIPGLKNPAKLHHANPPNFTVGSAEPLLLNKTVKEMKKTVTDLYKEIYKHHWFFEFELRGRLLWLKRSPGDDFIKNW